MIIDISQGNTPIKQGERAGEAPKTCGCGGKGRGSCGSAPHADGTGKKAQLLLLAAILLGSAVCYFLFS